MSKVQTPLDATKINEILSSMKKQASQIQGERMTMETDTMTSIFQNFSQVLGSVFQEKEKYLEELREANSTLEKIYSGHPDIRITMEKDAKEKVAPKIKGK